jgi:hypothetical protein
VLASGSRLIIDETFRAAAPTRPAKSPNAIFWEVAFSALNRTGRFPPKDGEDRASAVEPILFGGLINLLDKEALTRLLAKMPAGAPGADSENQFFEKVKTTFPLI